MFDKYSAGFYYQNMVHCSKSPIDGKHYAEVKTVSRKQVRKFKPYPLTTETMTKLATKRLRLGAKQVMKIAEKLYTSGYISYPRTETNKYNSTINLKSIIEKFKTHNNYGNYASKLIDEDQYDKPRAGRKDDKAHPPIHPVKSSDSLSGLEK